jgi:hypothetical protein
MTLEDCDLIDKNMEERYHLIKKNFYMMLKRHNEEQSSSLLIFAEAL